MLIEGGKAFFAEGKFPGGFNPSQFQKSWNAFLSSGSGVIFASFDGTVITGGLGALIYADTFNGDKTALEAFWYVFKKYRGHGIRLLDTFEKWAEMEQVKRVAMIHLESLYPSELKRLYERRGYKLIETHYVKEMP